MMVISIKQHLSNIWSTINEKVKQHCGWVEKKRCLWKKHVVNYEQISHSSGVSVSALNK